MKSMLIHRREFLQSTCAAAAAVGAAAIPGAAQSAAQRLPRGPVYARAGEGGIRPARRASRNEAILADGRRLAVSDAAYRVAPGKSVLLTPEIDGRWTVLYAEV